MSWGRGKYPKKCAAGDSPSVLPGEAGLGSEDALKGEVGRAQESPPAPGCVGLSPGVRKDLGTSLGKGEMDELRLFFGVLTSPAAPRAKPRPRGLVGGAEGGTTGTRPCTLRGPIVPSLAPG